jgi:pullulanase/glycogen debranching enzyme
VFVLWPLATLSAQPAGSDSDRLAGYIDQGERVTFLFDPALYGVRPTKVVVTGVFRNWDQGMDAPEWNLSRQGDVWSLSVDNPGHSVIRPQSAFKFRIDDGSWMDPPAAAPNRKGGDLIYGHDVVVPALEATLLPGNLVEVKVVPERPLLPADYRLTDAAGSEIPIAAVLPMEAHSALVKPAVPIDRRRVHFMEIPSLGLRTPCTFDGWFRQTYSAQPLGANIQADTTAIRLFAPRADTVRLYLYQGRKDQAAYRTVDLQVDADGVWEVVIPEDLHGVYYDFTIHGPDEPGNHFHPARRVHINDPYARVSDDTWGKARIWRETTPATPLADGIPAMEDVIAYEVHVQDFTDLLPLDSNLLGTFEAMTIGNLRNKRGEPIGFDYLTGLGINVVHLMPVQEYLHFPDEDWQASFSEDPYMIAQGISRENYQWGYRTTFAMALESRYRAKDEEPGAERDAFRDLVQAFHDKGMAVIVDIVPNHTGENMDGNDFLFNFNAIDQPYYYRTKEFKHIGAYGNEVKTEQRPMVQRWVIDQCLSLIREFGIDGFRIDLAGQLDEQTLRALRQAIGPDKILYGEAWIGSNDPAFEANPDWDWYKEDAPITFFQDDSRNAFKGPVFELKDKYRDRGWPGGKFDERENVMKALSNTFPTDRTPLSGIDYLDIHDNFALADQFATEGFDGRNAVDQDAYKIAATLLYTTLGPIVTHGGSEIMRSKAHAPLGEVVKETKAGYKIYLHGYRDTYNHRAANQFRWETVGQGPTRTNRNDYANMHAFWKGLNEFRRSRYGEVFRVAEAVPDGYYRWILPPEQGMLGYFVDDRVLVLLNAEEKMNYFNDIRLPPGNWRLVANTESVNIREGVRDRRDLTNLPGGLSVAVRMEPSSLFIWVLEEE